MIDPLQLKQQEEQRINQAIADKSRELIELIKSVNDVKEEKLRTLKEMEVGIEKMYQQFIDFLKEKGIAEVSLENIIAIRRKRG